MLRFLADENLNGHLLKGLLRRLPITDITRTQDSAKTGLPDPDLLAIAAEQNRILLTHDASTLIGFAYDRVKQGLVMPGVIEIPLDMSIRSAIDDLLLIATCGTEADFRDQVIYLPL